MGKLNRTLAKNEDAVSKKKENKELPSYGVSGKPLRAEKKRRSSRLLKLAVILALLIIFIYAPQYFIDDDASSDVTVETATDAIRLSNTALRNDPSGDFDGDGLLNSEETDAGTDPWNIDSDSDGMTDYYEVYVSDTDPTSADSTMAKLKKEEDEEEDKSLSTPYKIGNVILWADDYTSKANGSVVETMTGYHFSYFNGYAQFPEDGYVYKVENGIHTLLSYREEENAWKVSAGDYVEIFDEKLDEVVEFNLFTLSVHLGSNFITDILEKILPDSGFVTAIAMTEEDTEVQTTELTSADIISIDYDFEDTERFTENTNSLSDLGTLQAVIKAGGCALISLYNDDVGEYVGIAYAYDEDGNLLIADPNTLEYVGTLEIRISSKMIMDENGNTSSYTYFGFGGLGFESRNGDRISIFATAGVSSSSLSDDSLTESGDAEEETEEDEEEESAADLAEEASEELIEEESN